MSSTMIYIFIMIIILILLFTAFYYYYWAPRQTNTNIYKIPLLTTETIFDEKYTNTYEVETLVTNRDTFMVPKLGYGITFAWEMYIPVLNGNDQWQTSYNHLKPIISMNDSPVISYHPKKNYLSIVVKYKNNPFYSQYAELKFTDMKPQKWSKYIMIIQDRNVYLYINGTLQSTKVLPSVPVIYDITSEIILGEVNNNFLGKIRNLTVYPYPLSYTEVSTI